MCCTCVTVGTAGVALLPSIPVLGGERHACQVAHRVGKVPRQKPEVNRVILLGTTEIEAVFTDVEALFPVFQLDAEDGVSPGLESADAPEAQPELACQRATSERWDPCREGMCTYCMCTPMHTPAAFTCARANESDVLRTAERRMVLRVLSP